MNQSVPSMQQVKSAIRASWIAGDFGVIAKSNARSAEEFIARLGIAPGSRVLDVACGTGNLAVPLARLGAVVTGVDIAANLLEQARARAAAESLAITFDEGDAEALPYPDASFDALVTMFGAMFAPQPGKAAAEFARVLRPGALLAMANWNPESFTAHMFQVTGRHVPPPPGIAPPVLWGDDATVRARLSESFTNIQTQLIPIDFDIPRSPAGTVDFFRTYFGPTHMAFNCLDEAAQTAFAAELEALWSKANLAPDPENHTMVRNEYLQVTATRR